MRLDLSADAANSLFVVCLSNPAYAWNDHTKLMFPNGFVKFPDAARSRNISEPNAGLHIPWAAEAAKRRQAFRSPKRDATSVPWVSQRRYERLRERLGLEKSRL